MKRTNKTCSSTGCMKSKNTIPIIRERKNTSASKALAFNDQAESTVFGLNL